MKTIVLHDYFEALEGGGRLCSVLAQGVGADIGYGFTRPEHPFLHSFAQTQQIDLQSGSRIPLWRQFKLARAFAQHTQFLHSYDTVIYSGFYTPLAVTQHPQGKNILYCHTPPRFIYDQRDFYGSIGCRLTICILQVPSSRLFPSLYRPYAISCYQRSYGRFTRRRDYRNHSCFHN